jgi:two-component system cell cycle response regulator
MNLDTSQLDAVRPTVLVIDDSADVQRLLRARLRHEEMELVSAASGAEGLAMLERSAPAIILLDLDMPGMDGFEVLRALKNSDTTMHIPVIVLSALCNAEDKITAFDLGAMDYITKPFDITELRVRVRSSLRFARLLLMLAQRAQIDGLTGLWNRAHFERRWTEEVAGATRHTRALSVALLDIDLFKSVNDTFGHPAGDAVIQGLGTLLVRELRQSDIPCRYGGEEFALVMPDTGPADATVLCERIRATLAAVRWPRHPDRVVTASIGLVGAAAGRVAGAARWLEIADQNLYRAKRAGRNRVVATDIADAAPALARAG